MVVEDDKLQKAIDKAVRAGRSGDAEAHRRRDRFRSREPRCQRRRRRHGRRGSFPRRHRRRAHRALRQQTAARRHPPRRVGHPFRTLRKDVPHPPAHGRHPERSGAAAGAAGHEAVGAPQGHVAPRHRRAPRAAGRPHQDEAVEDSRHRFPREHLPDAVRRKDRLPYSRSVLGHAGHRLAGLRTLPARDLSQEPGQAAGHDSGHRTHGLGQDRVAVHRPQHPQPRRHQHLDRGRPGGNQSARRQPGQRQQQGRPHLRRGAARLPAPGSGRGHGRRNPRPRNGGDRHQGRADRSLGDVHAAHQRRAADAHAPRRHGREALCHRDLGQPDHRAAPGAPAVLAVQGHRRCSRRGAAQGRFPGSRRQGRHQDLRRQGLLGLHRRLQGPLRHLPGHAGHRSARPHHHGRRQRHRHRRPGCQRRRLGSAPRGTGKGQAGHDQSRRSQQRHDRISDV